jgi:molecular chaperone GrpE
MSETEKEIPDSGDAFEEAAAEQDNGAAKIAALEDELRNAKDQILRALAETENTRKRGLKDRDDARKYAVTDFARDLLDFSDNFSRALASIPAEAAGDERIKGVMDGLRAMEGSLLATLDKHGIKKITPLGEPFNPNFHEVMFEAPGSGKPPGTIVQVVDSGYVLHDRLLRPARVGIARDEGRNSGQVDTKA